jgi:hypothetical protein
MVIDNGLLVAPSGAVIVQVTHQISNAKFKKPELFVLVIATELLLLYF